MSISLQGRTPAFGAVAVARAAREAVYRAVWRWHFYAGLLCLPFLVSLSVTGSIYLFKDSIDATLFAHRTRVVAQAGAPLGPDRLIFNASQAVPDGVPLAFTDPEDAAASAVVTMAEGGRRILVYLNPYTGDVLDRVDRDGSFLMVVRRLHSLAYFGPTANALIEVVAGFSLILVVTGTYLWWPRGQGGVVSVRGTPRRRVWWRDLHAVTGLVAGGGLFFLALTGLPWSIWWGDQFRAATNAAGVGQPRALWADTPVSTVPMREVLTTAGWTLQDAPVPAVPARRRVGAGDRDRPGGGDPRRSRDAARLRDVAAGGRHRRLRGGGLPARCRAPADGLPRPVHRHAAGGRAVSRHRRGGAGRPVRHRHPQGRAVGARQPARHAGVLPRHHPAQRDGGGDVVEAAPGRRPRRAPVAARPRAVAVVTALVLGLGALFPLTGAAILVMIGLDLGVRLAGRGVRRRAAA